MLDHDLTSFEDALKIVHDNARRLDTEQVALRDAPGRILAADVVSDIDMPPFNKSAMDGYACRKCDLQNELSVIETIAAGAVPGRTISPNECSKIMTGAIVPDGADFIVPVEYTETVGETGVRCVDAPSRDNICLQGEDVRTGDVVLRAGELVQPQHVGVLATVGCASPVVSRRPRVGIVATGDELVEPTEKPGPSQIRNSNSYQLFAQAERAGAIPRYHGIALDTKESTDAIVKEAIAENDVILLSGGVSMGDFDVVPDILKENGIKLLFEKIAVKPGKPTVFGVSDDVFCFGLPGNPVSTFVIFELIVRPFLAALMGHEFSPLVTSMTLDNDVVRRRTSRASWFPVQRISASTVTSLDYHGSAHLNAFTVADGMICVPRGVKELKKGSKVDVRQV